MLTLDEAVAANAERMRATYTKPEQHAFLNLALPLQEHFVRWAWMERERSTPANELEAAIVNTMAWLITQAAGGVTQLADTPEIAVQMVIQNAAALTSAALNTAVAGLRAGTSEPGPPISPPQVGGHA